MRTHTIIESPLGPIALIANNGALCGLHMSVPEDIESNDCYGVRDDVSLRDASEQLDEYFARKRTAFDLDLAPQGNDFQMKVWDQLKLIPYGKTRSYGEIAEAVGGKSFARAVGSANHVNPIAIIVPCHRVIGADGSLVGFGGGLKRKEFLLHLENPERPIALTLF